MNTTGRREVISTLAMLLAGMTPLGTLADHHKLLIGMTPVFLNSLQRINAKWEKWLSEQTDAETHFIQRRSYEEIVQLLSVDKIQAAWLCGYPYVINRSFLDLAAVPLFRGSTHYHSYFIVRKDSSITRWTQLKNKPFAYSDPLSNSGWLYPNYFLLKRKIRPQSFFKKTFFTWGHPNTVKAVSAGLAHGGAVDSYVWEVMHARGMPEALNTRIIHRSPAFPQPAFVTTRTMPAKVRETFVKSLLTMGEDAASREILKANGLDGFRTISPDAYDVIKHMADFVERYS